MAGSRSRSRSPNYRRRKSRQGIVERKRSPSRDVVERRKLDRRRSRSRSPLPPPIRRRRSRSRSPRRRRSRSRTRSFSNDRSVSKDRNGVKETKSTVPLMSKPQITEADLEGKTDEEVEMITLMGFGSFDSTKGKHVLGNNSSAVNTIHKRKYRQYMNRKGGFNRPLDFVA